MSISLYDTDFDAWARQQAQALRAKDWAALDIDHLAEEVEELRKSELKAVRSQFRLLLSHLLKWVGQPEKRAESWRSTIANARVLIDDALEDSPSLQPELARLVTSAYPRACRDAAVETGLPLAKFPQACPWSLAELQDPRFLPGDKR